MEKYQAEITIPLGGSYSKYADVVNYLNQNGKIISQSRTSPYDWDYPCNNLSLQRSICYTETTWLWHRA